MDGDIVLIAWAPRARILTPAIREAMRSGVVREIYPQLDLGLDDLEGVGIEV